MGMALAGPFSNYYTAAFLSIVTIALWLLSANPVEAQTCSFSNSGLDFGSVDVSAGNRIRTSGSLTATCSGTPRAAVRVCANFDAGSSGVGAGGNPRQMLNSTSSLNYNIYNSPSGRDVWGSSLWPYSPGPKTFTLKLNNSGTKSTSTSIRGTIHAG